jgi:hypothetical protein
MRASRRTSGVLRKAETVPVPGQMPAYQKSLAVIALQLEKRWRNLGYDRRHPSLRRPPSVLMSYYNARHANQTRALAEELIHQVGGRPPRCSASVSDGSPGRAVRVTTGSALRDRMATPFQVR